MLLLTVCRESVWQRLAAMWSQLTAPPRLPVESMRTGLVLITVGLVGFVVQIVVLFPQNDSSAGEDEEAYLVTAREIAQSGGSVVFLESLFSGEFSEANRHPLYLWLLSGSPQFGSGKFLSALLGLWTLGMVLGLSLQRGLGWLRTGIICLLLGLNFAWGRFSVTVGCEVLMVGLVACIWFQFYGESFRCHSKSKTSASAPSPDTERESARDDLLMVWVAALLALVWLAKGTGLLLTAGFILWLIVRSVFLEPRTDGAGQRPARMIRQLVVFAAVWAAVASPLLTRNLIRYGSPFYNVNSWLLFVDEYENPVALSETQTISQAAATWLQSHSISDILRREVSGLFWESFILVRSLGPPPLDDARVIPGGLIGLLAGLGWLVSKNPVRWLLLIWLGICLPLFAWYIPVAAGERFVLPLLVPILCYAAEGTVHLAAKFPDRVTDSSA